MQYKLYLLTFCFLCFNWLIQPAIAQTQDLKGIVVDAVSRKPIRGAHIAALGGGSTTSNDSGAFHLVLLDQNEPVLEIHAEGYESLSLKKPDQLTDLGGLHIELVPAHVMLQEMVVMPSHFSLMQEEPGVHQFLNREEISNTPHLSDDVYRTVASLPGAVADDYSASFTVRGGGHREVLVLLDGMELYEPFHLKDFTGIFSIVDAEMIGGLDLMTGGFTAEYGDRMSGVFEMRTADPNAQRTVASLSFSNAGVSTEGSFAGGLGQYLFSARRGYIDLLLEIAGEGDDDEDLSPSYYDSLGKIQYAFNDTHALSLNFLLADDKLDVKDQEEIAEINSKYGSAYLWANLRSQWTDRLYSESVVFWGNVDQDRIAFNRRDIFEPETDMDIHDVRDHQYQGFKQDWRLTLSERQFLKAGFSYREVSADYDYRSHVEDNFTIFRPVLRDSQYKASHDGDVFSVYLADRIRLNEKLVAELGLRYDSQSYLDDSQISPRFNLVYEPSRDMTMHLAWGRYHQAQGIHELQIADEVYNYHQAEYADHWLLGLDYQFGNGLRMRVEGYYKEMGDLHTRFENQFSTIEVFPELEDDRIPIEAERAEAHGVELSLKHRFGSKFHGMFNYAYASVEDEINGVMVPRRWDQNHTVNINLNYRHSEKWNTHLAWHFNTGWKTTAVTPVDVLQPDGSVETTLDLGPLYEESFGAYHRLDFRLNRHVTKADGKGFTFFLDVTNLYNRKNVRGYEDIDVYRDHLGNRRVELEKDNGFPMLPSLGVNWVF